MSAPDTVAVCANPEHEPPRGTAEHARWLVHWHLEWENPEQLDLLGTLYSDDIAWEMNFPGEYIAHTGKDAVLANYSALLTTLQNLTGTTLECFSTPDRVFIDQHISYDVATQSAVDSAQVRGGDQVEGRLVHNFRIAHGLISHETAYFIPDPPNS